VKELKRIQKENIQIQTDALRAQSDAMRAHQEAMQSIEYARTEANRAKLQAERDRQRAEMDRERANQDHRVHEQLKRALMSDGLLENMEKYKMSLSELEMRVNGKVQPDEIRKKYLEYYRSLSGHALKNADSIRIEKN